MASNGQAAMEDGEQAGSSSSKAGGADNDEVLEVEDSSDDEGEGEGDENEEDDSDLDSVGSFNSQASEFKEMGSAAVRQKRLEHDRHRKARIEEKRRQKRLAKAAETIEAKRAELIAEMKGAAAAKDIDRLRQAITRAQDSACEFVIGRGKGKRRSPSLLRAMIEEQRLEETLEISAISERAEENRLRKLRRHFRRLEPHRTQALCLGRDGLRRTYWYYTHDRTAIYVEQPVFDPAAQALAVKEAARRAAHKAASAGGIASVSGATPLRPTLNSTGAAGAAGAVASDGSGSASSGAAAMSDGDEGEVQVVEDQKAAAASSSAPAAAAPSNAAVPTVLVGGTWDRLDDRLRIEAEERLVEDAVIAQAAIAQRQPKIEKVVWGRIETFEAVQQLLDSLDRRGEDEDDLFRHIEAWSQVLSSSIPTAEELEGEEEAGPQTDDEAMEDDEDEEEEGTGSKGGRGVGEKQGEEEEMDGAMAIAIKRSMRGNKAPRGTVESDDEGEAELELDSFKYGGGDSASGSSRPSREEREEMKEKERLEELERARNGGKSRKRGRVKYSAFIPRKRRRTESDAAVEQRTPGKLFSAFRNQRRTTLRRRLDLGHGAGSGSDGDSDEDEDGSDDSEVEELLNESLFEGGGGVEGVGNKDHPYDELSAPAGNLCSLRSTLLRMEEQLRDALHAAKAPWYVKAGQSTGGSGAASSSSSSSSSLSASSSSSSLMKLSVAGPIDLGALGPQRGAWVTDVRTATSPHQLSKAALLLEAQAYHPQRARRLARLAAAARDQAKEEEGDGDEEAAGKAASEDDPATGWSDGEEEDEDEEKKSKGSASEGGQAAMESGEEEEGSSSAKGGAGEEDSDGEGSRNGGEDEEEEEEEEPDLTPGAVWTLRSLRRRWRSAARRAVTVHSIAVLLLELQERSAVAGLCPAPTSLVVRATRKAALKKEREEAARRRREAKNKKKSGKGAAGSSRSGSAARGAATAGFEEAYGSRRSLRERTTRVSYSDMGGGGGDSDDEDYHRGSRRGRRVVIDSDEEEEDEEAERAKAELMGLRRSGRAAASNARRNIRRS